MLTLGPGSACDVCLKAFGAELSAPCSLTCGHVFCAGCLQEISRPVCPLCRTPFEARHTIRLHIDLDNIRSSASDELVVHSSTEEEACKLQKRISSVAVDGGTEESQIAQITEDCQTFLATVPKNMYSDLRASYEMLHCMCHLEALNVDQGRIIDRLMGDVTSSSQETDHLRAAIEVLKVEKRRFEQAWQALSVERDELSVECQKLHEELDAMEAELAFVVECNDSAQQKVVLLTEELQRLRSECPSSYFNQLEESQLVLIPHDSKARKKKLASREINVQHLLDFLQDLSA
ncbi:hypothetical protein DFH09DRAFT_1131481 [Mycena vulgaris]|nr:hypothetical protein DFH09DRAFT_1131481 [Mycena vulgaris]